MDIPKHTAFTGVPTGAFCTHVTHGKPDSKKSPALAEEPTVSPGLTSTLKDGLALIGGGLKDGCVRLGGGLKDGLGLLRTGLKLGAWCYLIQGAGATPTDALLPERTFNSTADLTRVLVGNLSIDTIHASGVVQDYAYLWGTDTRVTTMELDVHGDSGHWALSIFQGLAELEPDDKACKVLLNGPADGPTPSNPQTQHQRPSHWINDSIVAKALRQLPNLSIERMSVAGSVHGGNSVPDFFRKANSSTFLMNLPALYLSTTAPKEFQSDGFLVCEMPKSPSDPGPVFVVTPCTDKIRSAFEEMMKQGHFAGQCRLPDSGLSPNELLLLSLLAVVVVAVPIVACVHREKISTACKKMHTDTKDNKGINRNGADEKEAVELRAPVNPSTESRSPGPLNTRVIRVAGGDPLIGADTQQEKPLT